MTISEPFMTAALAVLSAFAAFALIVGVLTLGSIGLGLLLTGIVIGYLLPRPGRP